MITWLLFISAELLRNLYYIAGKKVSPDYDGSVIIRVFFGVVVLFKENPYLDPVGSSFTLLPALPFAVWQIASFYLLFDPILNIVRGKKWNHRGENSGKFFDKLPLPVWYGLKIVTLGLFIYTSIILLR